MQPVRAVRGYIDDKAFLGEASLDEGRRLGLVFDD